MKTEPINIQNQIWFSPNIETWNQIKNQQVLDVFSIKTDIERVFVNELFKNILEQIGEEKI